MPLALDREAAKANSRIAVIRLAAATLRCMENWRQQVGDYDGAMIMIAIVAISAEKLTRGGGVEEPLRDLSNPLPQEMMGPCNISSIAAATGLNRETTRRKVGELERAGLVVRQPDGNIGFMSGLAQSPETLETVMKQLEAITRLANGLIADGSIRIRTPDERSATK